MLLTDTDIEELLSPSSRGGFQETFATGNWIDSKDKLLIFPFDDRHDGPLTPVGYDLTIGKDHLSLTRQERITLERVGDELAFQPNETLLISTEEYIGLPKNRGMAGLIESKVSLVSLGLSHISTTLDPDYEGHLLIAITNHQSYPIKLKRGEAFCTSMFFITRSAATRSCNRPPGRTDIILKTIDYWNQKAKQAAKEAYGPLRKQLFPYILQVIIIIVVTLIGFLLTNDLRTSATIGLGIAVILLPAILLVVQRNR
jgi:deoxycytidine triphosphate deaminase